MKVKNGSGKAKSHRSRKYQGIVRVIDNPRILKICKILSLGAITEVHNGKHFNQYTSSNVTKLIK